MDRRDFLSRAGAATGLAFFDRSALLAQNATATDRWRVFEITTRVEVLQPSGMTRVWLPTPMPETPYQRTLGDTYVAGSGHVVMIETNANDPDILAASWTAGDAAVLTLTSRVATSGHAADLTKPTVPPLDIAKLSRFLRPTRLIPTDGVVKSTADTVTRGAGTDLERARAIYDWIVDGARRHPAAPGCGVGDIREMLESKDLSGKSVDLNTLFVGLVRAAGIPARILYGLRVAKSRTGVRSLGLSTDDATRAQHCRAEIYLTGYGWVPVDPADVANVMLEEGHLAPDDEKVLSAKARLFGSWEMNWFAYNFANDVALPGANGTPLPFFMYPHAETANGPLDSLSPDTFKYQISVSEVAR